MYEFPLSAEQELLQTQAKELSDGPVRDRAQRADETESYPWDTVQDLVDAGFMGMAIPTQFGGRGMSYLDAVLVIEQLARNCAITGRIVVEANMGGVGAVMAYGTDEQKRTVASHVLSGDKPAICITEPEAAVRPRPTCEPPRKGRPAATWSTGRSTGSRAAV